MPVSYTFCGEVPVKGLASSVSDGSLNPVSAVPASGLVSVESSVQVLPPSVEYHWLMWLLYGSQTKPDGTPLRGGRMSHSLSDEVRPFLSVWVVPSCAA